MFAAHIFAFTRYECAAYRQPAPGMMRFMKASNIGTVNAVSPWVGLHTMPFVINELRNGDNADTLAP